jgi:hypothetical protein
VVDDWERLERIEEALLAREPSLRIEAVPFGGDGLKFLEERGRDVRAVYVELVVESMTGEAFTARARALVPDLLVVSPSENRVTVAAAAADFLRVLRA